MPKPKAEMMRAKRQAREDRGLKPVTAYVKPEHKERLAMYVEVTLKGECPIKR